MRIGLACEPGGPVDGLLDLLEEVGLPAGAIRAETRPSLVVADGVTWFLGSAEDVLRGCDRGVLDAGIVGSDRLLEGRLGVIDLLDLSHCRDDLVLAVTPAALRSDRRWRVATRHPITAARHFAATGAQPEILVVDDPMLAPALGMADGIIELSARLHGDVPGVRSLMLHAVVAACSAHLVVSRAARVLRRDAFADLLCRLRAALEDA